MTGSALGLTERDRLLITEVQRFGVMTREQMGRLGFFHSPTRAKERLKRLVDAGYLHMRRQPLAAGGPRGIFLPGAAVAPASDRRRFEDASAFFLSHQLGLVDIRIAFERTTRLMTWLSDRELTGRQLEVIPDAYLEYEEQGLTVCAFVEYDRGTETLSRIEKKARAYIELAFSGRFARMFQRQFFRVLVVTDSPGRLLNLNQAVARVTDRIVRLTLLSKLQRQGPLASIWQRPAANTLESLTSS